MNELLFTPHEYRSVPQGISIPLDTVLRKLPQKHQKETSQAIIGNEADRMLADLKEKGLIYLDMWMDLNRQQLKPDQHGNRRQRSDAIRFAMLTECDRLRLQYGADVVDSILKRIVGMGEPGKANMSYLKTCLRNEANGQPAPQAHYTPQPQQGGKTVWDRMKTYLKPRLSRSQYHTWIEPITPDAISDERCALRVPDETFRWQIEHVYIKALTGAYQSIFEHPPTNGIEVLV